MAPGRAVIAIDHGTKRTGFAVADALRITVEPLEPYAGPGQGTELLEHLAHLLAERDVGTLLVGHPLRADGSKSARSLEVERFAERVRARFPLVSVQLHGEHSTTKEAESLLAEHGYFGLERKRRRDSWSALVLLRDWIAAGEPG
jgi:putative Holliday junction resolvase